MTAKRARRGRKTSIFAAHPRLRLVAFGAGVVLFALATWIAWPFWQLSTQFAARTEGEPSRLYGAPLRLEVGALGDAADVAATLESLGYRRVSGSLSPGEFSSWRGKLDAVLRPFPDASGLNRGGMLEVRFDGARVAELTWRGEPVRAAALEPPLVATFLGPERRERRPVRVPELPEALVHAVLAAEDAGFYRHAGLSPSGIARAAWVNLRDVEVRQGGSTLTQQLVKNLFLTHERTLTRKFREAVLAVLVDLRYDKEEILEAYLNEIYLGTSGSANLIGIGSAAWSYFGKRPQELDLCETALLAAIIRSPGRYSPFKHPERARARRDWVLGRMTELGWLEEERRAATAEEPLCVSPQPLRLRAAPYFVDFATREASERFGVSGLESEGYVLLSTLEPDSQRSAEEAVEWGLEALAEGWEKGSAARDELQAALVSLDPRTGGIRAYLGGRDYSESQFDRVSQAERQAGSAFKPLVYATAFAQHVIQPASFVEDAPVTVALAGRRWTPQNSDGDYRGWVTARTALERSLNVPTVRVALETGLEQIVETARALGISSTLQPVPALALGAFEVKPLELATAYATLAAGGVKPPVHSLTAVLDRDGAPVEGRALPEPERVLPRDVAFVVTSVLQGVLDRGTAASVRRQGLQDLLAGKTGTTNDRRDSWFAGYSSDRATLVWVGYDDNSPTRLSGARAALPIWARFTWKVRPSGGYPVFAQPPGVQTALIDPETGELATSACPLTQTEVFLAGQVPAWTCRLHGGFRDWRRHRQQDPVWAEVERPRGRWRWFKRIFGRKNRGTP